MIQEDGIHVVGGALAYSKFNGNREEVATSLLGNCIATGHTRKIDIAGLNKTLFTFHST